MPKGGSGEAKGAQGSAKGGPRGAQGTPFGVDLDTPRVKIQMDLDIAHVKIHLTPRKHRCEKIERENKTDDETNRTERSSSIHA